MYVCMYYMMSPNPNRINVCIYVYVHICMYGRASFDKSIKSFFLYLIFVFYKFQMYVCMY